MMVCRLELWPYGDKNDARHFGTIEIVNDEETSVRTEGRLGSYDVKLYKDDPANPVAHLRVEDHARLELHAWNIVRRILDQAAEMNGGTI